MENAVARHLTAHLIAAGGVLAAALYFQYFKGLAPCELCIWQRIPYITVLVVALCGLVLQDRILFALIALAYVTTTIIAGFHVGVEQGWWEGLSSCGSAITATDPVELMEQLKNAPIVRCEEIAWQFLGLSMAAWNAILSFGLAIIALFQWRFYRKGR